MVELNLVEFPLPLPSLWYLDFRAIHHVNDKTTIFSTMHHINNNNVRLASGQGHDVASINNFNIQFFDGVIKNIPHVLYSHAIQKKFLFIGFIVDQNHSIEFFFKRLFCVNRHTNLFFTFAKKKKWKSFVNWLQG